MDEDDIQVLEKEAVFKGYFKVDHYRLKHRKHSGDWSREISREVFERGHATAVLPYDPDLDKVILIEQFRVGALAAGRPAWLIEIVAGIIEEGETPQDVARREAVEECGSQIGQMEMISDYLVSPGGTSETVTLYCAHCDAANAGGIHGKDDEDEDIRVIPLPFDDAYDMVKDGRIANGAAVIAILWLALNRERLRQEWR